MSTTPVLLVRALDVNGDVIWGQQPVNFLTDADAVAQIVRTRLKLLQGEWWADQLDGLPFWQSIAGVSENTAAISLLIQQRILATPYVTGMSNVSATFNPSTRQFTFACDIQTQFGTVTIIYPQPPSQTLP